MNSETQPPASAHRPPASGLPRAVLRQRDRECAPCLTPCPLRDAHTAACDACPLTPPAWVPWDCIPSDPASGIRPQASDSPASDSSPRGLGDRVHAIAGPIGKAVHWPCVDQATGKLKPGSPCARARAWLNKKVPLTSKRPSSTK